MKFSKTFHFLKEYLRRESFSDREELTVYQYARLRKFIPWVRKYSAFYSQHWGDIPNADWQDFPIIDKSIMMANFDTLNTAGIYKEEALQLAFQSEKDRNFSAQIGKITVGLSSGTSGHQGLFLVSEKEQVRWAAIVLRHLLGRSLLAREKHKIAFFLRANSNLYESVQNCKVEFYYFDLMHSFETLIDRLRNLEPDIIVAPASILCLLVDADCKISPKKVISVAEVLDPFSKKKISDYFSLAIDQVYQCTEGLLATTCRYGTLHLNEGNVYFQKEYLTAFSDYFQPIITDFTRKTQPIIRYRLNDMLQIDSELCPCKSVRTAIKSIDGRTDDLLVGIRKDKSTQAVFPADFMRKAIMALDSPVLHYEIVQDGLKSMSIYLVMGHSLQANVQAEVYFKVKEVMDSLGLQTPRLKVEFRKIGDNNNTVKMRRVRREFDIDLKKIFY